MFILYLELTGRFNVNESPFKYVMDICSLTENGKLFKISHEYETYKIENIKYDELKSLKDILNEDKILFSIKNQKR